MKIYLGTDHAGFDLKEKVKAFLKEAGYDVEDCGAEVYERQDDYPVFIGRAARAVSKDAGSRGIVFGGSGQGEAMVANKFPGVRCALFYGPRAAVSEIDVAGNKSDDPFEMLRLTREHNDANVLSLGARFLKEEDAIAAVKIFLESPFLGEERHKRRIDMMEGVKQE